MALAPKGTPQRQRRDAYQLAYRKNYTSFHLMLDKRSERDMAILEKMNELPYKTKTEFLKRAVEEKFGLVRPERADGKGRPVDSFIAKLDDPE